MPDLVISDKEKIKSVLIIRLAGSKDGSTNLSVRTKVLVTVWPNTEIPRTAGTVPHRHF